MIRAIFAYTSAFFTTILPIPFLALIRKPYGNFARLTMVAWGKCVFFFTGTKFKVTGQENINLNESFIICSNHLHLLDIPALVLATGMNIRFAAKKELVKIPIFGTYMKGIGTIIIDRGDRRKAVASLREIEKTLSEHTVSIVMFPEGTRNKSGIGLLPFKKGAFMMALNTKRKILPITINDTEKIFEGFKAKPRTLNFHIHPAIDSSKYSTDNKDELMDTVFNTIHSKLEHK